MDWNGDVPMRFRLNQTIVYWSQSKADGFGRPAYATPVEIPCRWEDVIEETIDKDGNVVYSAAVIYTASALNVGAAVFLGTLLDTQESSWLPNVKDNNTLEIVNVSTVPSLKGGQSLTRCILK